MDTRKQRTKDKIKATYIDFLLKNKADNLSVTELCKVAKINRSTFYEFYDYIDLLVNDIIVDQLHEIFKYNDELYDKYHMDNHTSAEECEKYILNFASNKIIKKLLSSSNKEYYKTLIINITLKYEIDKYNIKDSTQRASILYRNNGVFSVVFDWMEKGTNTKKVAEFLYNQISKENAK